MLGGKSPTDVNTAVQSIITHLHSIGIDRVQYNEPIINNICSSGYVGFKIHLTVFANHPQHRDNCIYEQEQYPGLRYRGLSNDNTSITATIFASGKCIVTGAKQQQEIIYAFNKLLDICLEFKITGTETDLDDHHIYTNIDMDVDTSMIRFIETGSLYLPINQ